MRNFLKNQSFAYFLSGLIGLAAIGFSTAHATDDVIEGIQYKFDDECTQVTKAGKIKIDPKLRDYNPKCDHEWALKNAESVYFVYESYTEKVYNKITCANDTTGKCKVPPFADLQKDGVCMDTETEPDCKDRWQRQMLNAKIETRNKTLKYNKARNEMVIGKRKTMSPDNFARPGTPPPTGKRSTVLNDFYRASQNKAAVQKILAPQDISFQSKEVLDPNLKINKAQDVEVTDQKAQQTMGLTKAGSKLEIESGESDAKLQKLVNKSLNNKTGKNDVYSRKNYEKDTKAEKDYVDNKRKSKQKITING